MIGMFSGERNPLFGFVVVVGVVIIDDVVDCFVVEDGSSLTVGEFVVSSELSGEDCNISRTLYAKSIPSERSHTELARSSRLH